MPTREHIYKAKRKDNGEWVEGYYINLGDRHHYICAGKLNITKGYPEFVHYAVIPETVCECTGLTDKNGNRIFEGDIIETLGVKKYRFEIRYGKYIPREYCLYKFKDYECFGWFAHMGKEDYQIGNYGGLYKVIGNIYDNPELLEVKE